MIAVTVQSVQSGLFDKIAALFDRIEKAPARDDTDLRASQGERRRMILEMDPQSCGSELGAQMLMAQFPHHY